MMTDTHLAEASLAENFDKVEVIDAELLNGRSSARRDDGRLLGASVVHTDDAHPGPGAGHGSVWLTLHRARTGRRFDVCVGGGKLVVGHQHHLAVGTAEDLVDVGVDVVVVTVAVTVSV